MWLQIGQGMLAVEKILDLKIKKNNNNLFYTKYMSCNDFAVIYVNTGGIPGVFEIVNCIFIFITNYPNYVCLQKTYNRLDW